MSSGCEKREDERNVSVPYKTSNNYAILRQITARQAKAFSKTRNGKTA